MNLIEFLRTAKIEDLGLPAQITQTLRDQNLTEFQKVYCLFNTISQTALKIIFHILTKILLKTFQPGFDEGALFE
jgi:hypothetical protein